MFLQDYDFIWDNYPSSQMDPANALLCCNEVNTLLNNTTIIMLPSVSDVLICALDVRLAKRIADFTVTDPLVEDAVDAMSKQTSLFPCTFHDDWVFLDGILYFKGCLYIWESA